MLIDIVGIAKEVQPLGSVKRKSDGADLPRRDLTLVDQRWGTKSSKLILSFAATPSLLRQSCNSAATMTSLWYVQWEDGKLDNLGPISRERGG